MANFAVLGNNSSPVTVSPTSKSLDVSFVQQSSGSAYELYLFYEDIDGNEQGLYCTSPYGFRWNWTDIGISNVTFEGELISNPVVGCAQVGQTQLQVLAIVQVKTQFSASFLPYAGGKFTEQHRKYTARAEFLLQLGVHTQVLTIPPSLAWTGYRRNNARFRSDLQLCLQYRDGLDRRQVRLLGQWNRVTVFQ